MRKPFAFALAVAAVAVAANTAQALYPTPPPSTELGAIPNGTCVLEGHDLPPAVSVPEPVEVVELVLRCQLSDDVDRLFTFPVANDDPTTVLMLAEVLERLGPLEDEDEFTPQ